MTLALLSLLTHHLDGVQPFKLTSPLAGALLICACASFSSASESFQTNADKDIVSGSVMDMLGPVYVGEGKQTDEFSEPIRADAAWWKDLPVRKLLNVYGEYEMFKDDVVQLGGTLKDAGCDVETLESPKHVHVDAILDEQVGFEEEGEMAQSIWAWLSGV
jgi:acetyl esterase/lipase